MNQYCGEHLWPRSSELSLRPQASDVESYCLEQGIAIYNVSLESSVISFIPPSSELYVQIGGIKPHLFHFICLEYKVIHVDLRLLSVSDPFYEDASHADPGLNQQVSH